MTRFPSLSQYPCLGSTASQLISQETYTIRRNMHLAAILGPSLAATSLAQSSRRTAPEDSYHGVGLALVTSPWGEPIAFSPAPVELNRLTDLHNFSCYRIIVQKSVHPNVDITKVECRAYKDAAGQIPGSAPFNYNRSADLATNIVQVGSVLCYVMTDDESRAFSG